MVCAFPLDTSFPTQTLPSLPKHFLPYPNTSFPTQTLPSLPKHFLPCQAYSRDLHLPRSKHININTAALPVFAETASPELDQVLSQLRTKHFIPAYLNKRQRHLIFGDKFKQELENNPAYATLGEEELPLLHIDRRTEIPARKPLVLKALQLIQENDEWRQLPSLLEGLHKARPTPDLALQEKILRKLQQADQFPVILRSLRRSQATGLTLKNDAVLNQVLHALREAAALDNWEQTRLQKALKYANELAELLESEQHGSGRKLSHDDARKRPAVIGLFLELHAVYASQYQAGQDVDGKVKAYATRFMACFNKANEVNLDSPSFPLFVSFPKTNNLVKARRNKSPFRRPPY
jgi:hypothetical protein